MPTLANIADVDDMEMDMGTRDYLNRPLARPDLLMTASRLEQDPDAMDIDVAPTFQGPSPASQSSLWADYLDNAFQLLGPSRENISARPSEALHNRQNNNNIPRDYATTMCAACMEMVSNDTVVSIDCGCHYCKSCFNSYFETGLVNRGSFPPRCCGQEILLHSVCQYLENRIVKRYEGVQEEFGSKDPTYCANCGTFLPGAITSADFKTCRNCLEQTCIRCKNLRAVHEGHSNSGEMSLTATGRPRDRQCPVVSVPPEIMALVKKEAWKRCPSCQHLVEKTDGCNFMQCICGTEFCYGCGVGYGTNEYCECPDNLVDEEDGGDIREEVDEDEAGVWPQYSAAVDARGRIRCTHELTSPLNGDGDDDGDNSGRCHGCLQEMPEIRSCDACLLELCSECLR